MRAKSDSVGLGAKVMKHFAIRTNSRYAGHPLLVDAKLSKMKGRSHHWVHGYMIAGATAGEIIIAERDFEYVSFPVWLMMVVWMGARYQAEK